METRALLLLLALCVSSDANFYGNSVSFMAPKRNRNGTFTVGRSMFVFRICSNEPVNKKRACPG